jgi:hypothetical protein
VTVPAYVAHMSVLCSFSLVDLQREINWQPVPLASCTVRPRSAAYSRTRLAGHVAREGTRRNTPALRRTFDEVR